MLDCVVSSHLTSGFARLIGVAPKTSVWPGPKTALRLPVTSAVLGYAPILSLPIFPQLARSLSAEIDPASRRNGSSFRFHPAEEPFLRDAGSISALKLRASW